MALNKVTLQTELESWMGSTYTDINDAANAFANAYDTYAQDALDVSNDGPDTLNKQGIIDAFITLTTSETPTSASVTFEDAIIAYWNGGTFELLTPPAGTITPEISANVTGNIATSAISTDLKTVFENTSDSAATKASQIADILDTATKTVIVTCVGTNAAPPPATISVPGAIT